ncbi:hypothetical protein [Nostoc sp.]|uniref:hypothetical protein n=1 Tax=Nostoc sp. TaxID=1180 RepID=UPI00359474D1
MLLKEDRQALKKDGYRVSANGRISPIARHFQQTHRRSFSSGVKLLSQGKRDSINNPRRPIQSRPSAPPRLPARTQPSSSRAVELFRQGERDLINNPRRPIQPRPSAPPRLPARTQPSSSRAMELFRQGERDSINNPTKAIAPVGEQNNNNALNQTSNVVRGIAVGAFAVSRRLPPPSVPTEASRAAKPLVLRATLPDGSKSIRLVPLRRVHSSQATISNRMGDGTPFRNLVDEMKKHGWDYTKEPPDMVKFLRRQVSIRGREIPIGRSRYVTLDHRRLAAAKEAGIKNVPARVHLEHDPITKKAPSTPGMAGWEVADRFKLTKGKGVVYTDPETGIAHRRNSSPTNWGEAAKHRAASQRVRGHENFPLKGKQGLPTVSEPSTSTVVKAFENAHVQRAVRGTSKVLLPVAAALDVVRLNDAYQKDGFGQEFRRTAGSVAGGWGAAAGGAAIGMAVGGPPGAIVGGIIGGVVGSEFGDDLEQGAEEAGKAIADGAKNAWNNLFG